MKFLVILALAVAAEAQFIYPGYTGYTGLPVTSYVQKPLVTSYVHKPVVYTKPVYTKPVEYHAQSAGVSHTVLKREAEPYHHMPITTYGAMPVTTYTAGYPYMTGFTHGVKTPTYSNDAVTPYGHQTLVHPTQSVVYKQAVQPVVYKQAVQPVMYTKPVVPLVYNTPIVQKVQPVNYMA